MTAAERQRKRRAALRDAAAAAASVTKPNCPVTKCITTEEHEEWQALGDGIVAWLRDCVPDVPAYQRVPREICAWAAGYLADEPGAAARWLTLALTSIDPEQGVGLRAFRDALIDEIRQVDNGATGKAVEQLEGGTLGGSPGVSP
jgi:hypothetical protein